MKTLKLLFLTAALVLASAGCRSTTNTAGRLLASSVQTVDAAMQAWWTYELLGHATPDQIALARESYAGYQEAEAIAEVSYIEFVKTGDATGWQRAADALRNSQLHLLSLITQFQKPAPAPNP